MSATGDGSIICCDGEGCAASSVAPVGLHTLLSEEVSLCGWLFVLTGKTTRHYCPRCSQDRLPPFGDDAPPNGEHRFGRS
jgi:hypothetical protein